MRVMSMKTPCRSAAASLLMCGLALVLPGVVGAAASQDADSVKLGEAALRFAAGSIRESMPQDGIVNFITGDNQTIGNRMILGWKGSDVLYLRLRTPSDASLGDLYTVYRKIHKAFHPATKRYLGYVVNMLAVVRVIQVDHDLATVQIVRSYAPLSPGDPVMRFVPPVPDEEEVAASPRAEIEAMIVDLQADKNMMLVGQGNLVYLDRGRADGLRAGDVMDVDRMGGGLPRRKVAELKILSTEDGTATALITKSMARVMVGDRIRYGLLRDSRSDGGTEDRSLLVAVGAEASHAAAVGADMSTEKVRFVPGADGTRIELDDLVEQLEYDSGEVKVKAPGLVVLARIADFLRTAAPNQPIRVEGHADNMEIGPSLKAAFPSNWELSRARAAGIVRYLVENAGLDSAKLTAVGYGASRPMASNATEEGRKRNRRVELIVLGTDLSRPEQSTGDDIRAQTASPMTNASHGGSLIVPVIINQTTQAVEPSPTPNSDTGDPSRGQPTPVTPPSEAKQASTEGAGAHPAPAIQP
jgi:chemotaxis protein MotB